MSQKPPASSTQPLEVECSGNKAQFSTINRTSLWAYCIDYMQHCQDSGLAQSSLTRYSQELRAFTKFCDGQGKITPDLIRKYWIKMKADPRRSGPALKHKFVIISQLFNYLVKRKIIASNPVSDADLTFPKYVPSSEIVEPEEYERLKSAAVGTQYFYPIVCLRYSGLRVSDVFGLKWENVDLKKERITIMPRKTVRMMRETVIPLLPGSDLTIHLNHLWQIREAIHPKAQSPYVAPSMTGTTKWEENRAIETCKNDLTRFVRSLGFKKKLHSFRRTMITDLLANGVDHLLAMRIVGISDPKTMLHYAAPTYDTLRDAMAKVWLPKREVTP